MPQAPCPQLLLTALWPSPQGRCLATCPTFLALSPGSPHHKSRVSLDSRAFGPSDGSLSAWQPKGLPQEAVACSDEGNQHPLTFSKITMATAQQPAGRS